MHNLKKKMRKQHGNLKWWHYYIMDCSYIQFSIYFYHSLKLFYLPKNQQVVILKIDFLPPISPISNEGCVINTLPTFRILSTLFISYLCRLSFLRIDINVFSITTPHIRTESKFRWQICGATLNWRIKKINQTRKPIKIFI